MAKEIKVLLFRGTWAPLDGDGILGDFARQLSLWADVEWVNYPASYGQPSYDISINQGVRMGLDALRRTDKLAFVAGYSQGADVAGYLHALLNGTMPNVNKHDLSNCEVRNSFLIADPSRAKDAQTVGGPVGGWGIRGGRPVGRGSYTIAVPGDPICAYPDGPLRSFADFSAYYGDPDAVEKIRKRVREKSLQPWWRKPNPLEWGANWFGTLGWINNYFSGFHTDQYIKRGYIKQLADVANKKASEIL